MSASTKGKQKSEKHHWWPECVSRHWANDSGKVNWLLPNGDIKTAPPAQFGSIGNGHYIKLGNKPGEATVWDQNFEPIFDQADNYFPEVISWLQSLERKEILDADSLTDRFIPQDASDQQISKLVECIVSLAIRGPMHRETAVRTAETIRGQGRLPERERNTLIALNMRESQRRLVSLIGTRGKFAILYSPSREFIYGDGFFHNITSPVQFQIHSTKILVPITPEICVLYAKPMQCIPNPRLFTFMVTEKETDVLNKVVQIYSCNSVFFKSQMPTIIPEYKTGEHMAYRDTNNPVDSLISAIPGVIDTPRIFF